MNAGHDDLNEVENGARSPETATASSPRGPIRVWLVDDSKNFRATVADLLGADTGLECARQFPSAEAALEALPRETPPDVILLDVEMGGLCGLDAIRPIKAIASSTHVVMLTGYLDPYCKQQALTNGATEFLSKSFDLVDISARVRKVVEQPAISRTPDTPEPASAALADGTAWETAFMRRAAQAHNGRAADRDAAPLERRDACRTSSRRKPSNGWSLSFGFLRALFSRGR